MNSRLISIIRKEFIQIIPGSADPGPGHCDADDAVVPARVRRYQ